MKKVKHYQLSYEPKLKLKVAKTKTMKLPRNCNKIKLYKQVPKLLNTISKDHQEQEVGGRLQSGPKLAADTLSTSQANPQQRSRRLRPSCTRPCFSGSGPRSQGAGQGAA